MECERRVVLGVDTDPHGGLHGVWETLTLHVPSSITSPPPDRVSGISTQRQSDLLELFHLQCTQTRSSLFVISCVPPIVTRLNSRKQLEHERQRSASSDLPVGPPQFPSLPRKMAGGFSVRRSNIVVMGSNPTVCLVAQELPYGYQGTSSGQARSFFDPNILIPIREPARNHCGTNGRVGDKPSPPESFKHLIETQLE